MFSKIFKELGQTYLRSNSFPNKSSFNSLNQLFRNYSSANTSGYGKYETLEVSAPQKHIIHVRLNRPDKRNSMNRSVFSEMTSCFAEINDDKECRVVVLSGSGKTFCAGLDFQDIAFMMSAISGTDDMDVSRKAKIIRDTIFLWQKAFNCVDNCSKPVIASIHGGCVGAGIDLICGTDIRYSSTDAFFSIREVGIGMAADMGTLQRLPKIVGNHSLVRELAFTARNMSSSEAKELGLISKVFSDSETCLKGALETAQHIAANSPVAVQGTKIALNYSRDHTIKDGLEFIANWNMCMLQTEDLIKAASGVVSRSETPPIFNDF